MWIIFVVPEFTNVYAETFFAFRICWDLEPTVPTGRSQNKDILTKLRVWVYLYDGGSRHTTLNFHPFNEK